MSLPPFAKQGQAGDDRHSPKAEVPRGLRAAPHEVCGARDRDSPATGGPLSSEVAVSPFSESVGVWR